MRKSVASLACLMALLWTFSGCIVHTSSGHSRHRASKRCHPSKYWDGHKCRKKGKRYGHKKHKRKHKKHKRHSKRHR